MVPGAGGARDFTEVWLTTCAEGWGMGGPGSQGTEWGCHRAKTHAWGVPEGTTRSGLCRLLGASYELV